ncbi:polymerase delta-interacting protein 3 isoform X1 [Anguilla anguilla]|uniref:polymerase delta-interacting protein 3 isoform X1 n=1 Tax=Anguilla anguilla TaxID=7936 RepID=UPI0015AF9912|nr:polymerase delta-interacting protein 3 isoform X1 [Anguilla anguilla]
MTTVASPILSSPFFPVTRASVSQIVNKMADLSLDELIRRRGLNTRGATNRPGFRRGGGVPGRTFDARQKIGTNDVRQRLGGGGGGGGAFQIKDAREKLGQKDARFRIRGGGAGGGVQDARQMINSRKQQQGHKPLQGTPQPQMHSPTQVHFKTQMQHIQIHSNTSNTNTSVSFSNSNSAPFSSHLQQGVGSQKVIDARDRLSLKRSIGATPTLGSATPLKITKTIQQKPVGMTSGVRINVPTRNAQSLPGEDDTILSKQMKITTANSFLHTQPGAFSGPITKVVQNDSYTAPAPLPSPVAPRASPSPVAQRSSPAALQPVCRTVAGSQAPHAGASGEAGAQLTAPQPVFSPLEGTKMMVNNLHPRVSEEDIVELFCVCGALKRARLLKVGVAEVVFVRKEDAVTAYRKYNNRCLDGQPMKCNLHIQGNVITSDQPILLRLSDTPGGGGGGRKDGLPPSLSRPGGRPASSQPTPEVDPQTILKALFKSSPQTPSTTDSPSSQSTAFRIKI